MYGEDILLSGCRQFHSSVADHRCRQGHAPQGPRGAAALCKADASCYIGHFITHGSGTPARLSRRMADEVEEPPVESLAPSASPSFGAPKPARANNGVHKVAPEPPPGGHHCRVTRPTTPGAWQDGTEHQVLKPVSFEADPGSTVVVSTTATNAAASRPYLVTGDLTTEESGTSPSTTPTRSRTMKMRRQQTLSFLSRTTPRVKISVSADFKRHAAKISQQLRQRDRDRVWVVDPRDSCLLSTWDAITTCALIYSRRRLSRPLEPLQHTRAPLQHTRAPLQHTSFSVP